MDKRRKEKHQIFVKKNPSQVNEKGCCFKKKPVYLIPYLYLYRSYSCLCLSLNSSFLP